MSTRTVVISGFVVLGSILALSWSSYTPPRDRVDLRVFAPKDGDVAGIGGRAFLVDLVARFRGDLASTGASPELTGPGAHANANPFPGTFSLGANADHFPGLVTLLSTTHIGAGAGQNVSNLFNIVAITDRERDRETDVWSTWIIGDPNAFATPGQNVETRLFVAVVEGTAPDVVEDMNHDGQFDEHDLERMGFKVISDAREIEFTIKGN